MADGSIPSGDAEPFHQMLLTDTGRRVFDVSIEGGRVIDDLDLHATAPGQWVAYDRTFHSAVGDGQLDLRFSASVNNALLNAIVILAEDNPFP